MDAIKNLFTVMFKSKVANAKRGAEALARRETVGRVQEKAMNANAKLEKKMNDKQKALRNKAKGTSKEEAKAAGKKAGKKAAAAGKKAKAAGKKAGQKAAAVGKKAKAAAAARKKGKGRRVPGAAVDEPYEDDFGFEDEPMGAPVPMSSRASRSSGGDGGEKTQSIDISAIIGGNARELVGWLVATNGNHKGEDFRLFDGKNVLGTAADCDMVVTDPYLSAKHCTIRHEDGNFVLIDLDSTNGTFVNQKKTTKTEMIDNDTLRIGRTEFKFKSLF